MNDASRRRLDKVHPELASRIQALLDALTQHGLQVEVVQGLRTFAEQDGLFAQGRSKPGPVVTRARGGQSNHNYGLAVDLVPFTNGQPNWNAPLGVWTTIGSEAEKLGLEWGGDWKKFVDKPHVQLPGMSVAECLSLYRRGGNKLDLVWAEATRRLLGVAGAVAGAAAVGGSVAAAPGATGTSSSHPTLRMNARGDAVRALQEALAAAGFLAAGSADGIFGSGTQAAVKKFQQGKGLTADGIVGTATWEALLSAPSSMKGIPKEAKSMPKSMTRGAKKPAKKAAKKASKKASKKR
ncbi:MAG TPA: peptidoglycan-binding protein [Pyrinomonadaceae bacterium]|nr:peptidoglycan-binding protein [Pyrinomonadaceae bacterium]